MNADFYQSEIKETGNDRVFSYHPLSKNNSNFDHDNKIHQSSLTESIEELVG